MSKDNSKTITQKEKSIKTNADGTTTITSNEVSKSVKNEIQLDSDTKVKVSEVDAGTDDALYLEVIKKKDQLAILKDTNHYICMLSLKHLENILKKMGSNLKEEINLIAFGIYSMEEINEIKKSFIIDVPKVVFENVTKNLEFDIPEVNRLNENENYLDNKIFENVQEKLDFIKAEEERKRKEEEERKRKIEEEKRKQMEIKEKKREKAKMKLKKIREDNIKEILLKKFAQYRENIKGLKIVETKKTTETEKKVLRLKIKKDPNKNKAAEEAKKKKEEEERKKKEEEEARKKKEEEERKKREEEEARKKKEEEEERKKKLEEERKKKEEEEARKKKEEEERKRLEEEARKKKEEEERKRLEEEARKKKEEEDERKRLEEEARKKKEQEEKEKLLQEKLRKEKEEQQRLLKEKEEEERRRLELEKSKNQEQPTTNIESSTNEPKEEKNTQKLRNINLKRDNIDEKEKESEQNEDSQKPKKKKVIKKVKKIIKIPKKKTETIDNRKPFYVSGSTTVYSGGIGRYYENTTYTGHIPKSHISPAILCECDKCHNKFYNTQQIKNSNDKTVLYVCENCANKLKNANNNIKTLKSYDYYHSLDNEKYDPMNEKEFYEKNRNRYIPEVWKNNKKGIKSKSIEKVNKNKIDEDSEFDRYINGLTSDRYGNKDNNMNRKIKRCRNNSTEVNRQNLRYDNGNHENNNINTINGMNKMGDDNEDNIDERIKIINYSNDKNLKEMECPQCKNSYVLTREIRFYHCSDCKKIMCGKCSKKHYLEFPEHHCSNTDINGIVTNLSYEFTNDMNNNKYNTINNLQNKDNKKTKLNVKKYLNKNPNQEKINNNINYNEKVNSEFNDKDYLNQNNINNNYLDNYNDIIKEEENGAIFNYDDCFLCGIKQRENPQDRFYKCRECDRLLCQSCKKKHDLINPEHNLVISYISGEINPDLNQKDELKDNICIHCQNKILNENNEDNISNNNSNVKLRKEKINQNIQNMQIIQDNQNYILDKVNNNINNKTDNDTNNNLYENKNYKSYPYDNDEYYMKTQYQNDYSDKYILYKNIMNNNNDNNNNVDINNNKDYYNPINEYENMESSKKMSPTKKRILIKRHENLSNPSEDNYNKEVKSENKNKDLFKKRKCKIEFDLNKNETEFDKCEIFGNPVCYNCLKSKKDEKYLKIFYCSQCMKLFCKDCLYQHNYISIGDE